MGLPGHRRTSGDKRRRAAHFALKPGTMGTCTKCGAPVRPHRACSKCGNYKNKTAVNVEKRAHRKTRSAKAKK